MRNISELFEFLSNYDKEKLFTELNDHCESLITKNGTQAFKQLKFDVETLNTLFRMSEWFFEKELRRLIDEKNPKSYEDEIMTVEEVALYTKSTPAHIYKLIDKGKLSAADFSAVDKPGARKLSRVRKSEVDRFFDKK